MEHAMVYGFFDSPVGRLRLCAQGGALCGLLRTGRPMPSPWRQEDAPVLALARAQLAEYFAGTRRTFTVPLALKGTPFQRRCWAALLDIPYGQTRTYGQQAAAVGNSHAARAVGMANRANPVMILIPCHRVIGANGSLTGYAGGMDMKRFLLALEQGQAF